MKNRRGFSSASGRSHPGAKGFSGLTCGVMNLGSLPPVLRPLISLRSGSPIYLRAWGALEPRVG